MSVETKADKNTMKNNFEIYDWYFRRFIGFLDKNRGKSTLKMNFGQYGWYEPWLLGCRDQSRGENNLCHVWVELPWLLGFRDKNRGKNTWKAALTSVGGNYPCLLGVETKIPAKPPWKPTFAFVIGTYLGFDGKTRGKNTQKATLTSLDGTTLAPCKWR